MSHSGVSVGMMGHKRERYESEWSKCEREENRRKESMCYVNRNSQPTKQSPRWLW